MNGRWLGVVFAVQLLLSGCDAPPVVELPSANQSSRIQLLVIHFTSENYAESLRLLTTPEGGVSAHYLLPDPRDPTYDRDRLEILQLVPEARRAWHAGYSRWGPRAALNDSSIGIEIVNESRCRSTAPDGALPAPSPELEACEFLPFDEQQLELVVALVRSILARHPDIEATEVVGHADIAPDRRVDPGPLFPWQRLHEAGVGAWPEAAAVARWRQRFTATLPPLALLQRALAAYGYGVDASGEDDAQTRFAVRAFQLHFRPARYDGRFDAETAAVLFALLERYRSAALEGLAAEYNEFSPPARGNARG